MSDIQPAQVWIRDLLAVAVHAKKLAQENLARGELTPPQIERLAREVLEAIAQHEASFETMENS